MDYPEIIDILYSDDLDSIIKVINKSVFIEDIRFPRDKSTIGFHTGFTFNIQTDTQLELIYQPQKGVLIRQVRNPISSFKPINGLFVAMKGEERYFKWFVPKILAGIIDFSSFHIAEIQTFGKLDQNKVPVITNQGIQEIDAIGIYDTQGNCIDSYPLHKHLSKSLFFGKNQVFTKF